MSSDALISFSLSFDRHHVSAVLSGTNVSIISKAHQIFGETLKALAYDDSIFYGSSLMGYATLQMKFEYDGIVSASPLPCFSSDLLLGEAAVLFVPKLQTTIRKRYETTPEGYPPGSQLHLSNEYFDNPLVLTIGRIWDEVSAGKTMIVNDIGYGIDFYGKWRGNEEKEPHREGLPFGGTTHETMHVGSSLTYSFEGELFFFVATTPPQLSDI